MTVADEVYMLYPEDPGNLNRVKDRPEHQFFKKYGEAMPAGDWHHPGTKQGIYMMGPNAEYLEGRFAASGDPGDMRARMTRALERWTALAKSNGYANSPVPSVKTSLPPGITGSLILKVNLRDLPRGGGDTSGSRIEEVKARTGQWNEFTKWAWNENWIGLPDARSLVPSTGAVENVSATVIERICREVLVDNVRGQAPRWKPEAIKEANLTMRIQSQKGSLTQVEYTGSCLMDSGANSYRAKLYGQSTWNSSSGSFEKFDLVATGMRSGAWQFNQREQDKGPAPMGVSLSLYNP